MVEIKCQDILIIGIGQSLEVPIVQIGAEKLYDYMLARLRTLNILNNRVGICFRIQIKKKHLKRTRIIIIDLCGFIIVIILYNGFPLQIIRFLTKLQPKFPVFCLRSVNFQNKTEFRYPFVAKK